MTRQQVLVATFAGLYILVAVVWATITGVLWRLARTRATARPAVRPLTVAGALVSCGFVIGALFTLVPPAVHEARPLWMRVLYVTTSFCFLGATAGLVHLAWRLPFHGPPPRRTFLAVLYGSAAVVLLLDAWLALAATPHPALRTLDTVVHGGWEITAIVAAGWRIARIARSGSWDPDTVLVVRRRDVTVIAGLALTAAVMSGFLLRGGWDVHPWALNAVNIALGLMAAVPLAARMLGAVVRVVLLAGMAFLLTGGIYAATQLVVLPRVAPALGLTVHVGTVALIVALLVPGQRWLANAIDWLVLRRSRRQRAELNAFMHTLSPALGRSECARRVLRTLVRVLALRGAAVVLRDGTAFSEGSVDVEPLRAGWPREAAADALPGHPFSGYDLAASELRDLLVERHIASVVPIVSPQRRWGDVFVSTTQLGTAFAEEDLEILETAARQLALLLDGTELLERAVAVERSLAHAEKLAAIGETAARIAHDIRNPVTAARSLAQQLAHEPAAPFRGELQTILEELDRIERQVADLLQFARREDLRFELVDLGALARATVAQLRPRLESVGVIVALDLEPTVAVRADRERLRQLIVNLVENAVDALYESPRRELSLSVATTNGTATLRVSDTGPGVPVDALAHLFEPFFSLKPHGTGLGLAIAKRTVDAHGGHISAAVRPEGGMVFDVGLPPASADAA